MYRTQNTHIGIWVLIANANNVALCLHIYTGHTRTMGTLDVPFHQLTGVSFSLYSNEEIRKLSVKEITNPVSLDVLLHPTYGGLYDPALGKASSH